jgi:hypothetical protein
LTSYVTGVNLRCSEVKYPIARANQV